MKQNIQVPLLTRIIGGNYLAHWLNLFVKAGFISSEHLLYQTVDAFICEQINQPNPVTNWTQWPTLSSFCESMFDIATRKGYRFFLGSKRYGLKDERDTVTPATEYCYPGPSVSTLESKKPCLDYNGGHHLNNIMLLLTLLDSLDGIPSYKAAGVRKYFTCIHYDGMPLNIGTFPRQENGKTFFDGISPRIKLEKTKELYKEGNVALHKYITDNCSWISEVREYDMVDASGTVSVNVYTKFSSSGGDAESVKKELHEALQPLEACGNCILSNNAKNCTFNSLKGPCETCTNFSSEESPCVSAKIIHVSSDQAAAQRRAHAELSAKATQDLNDSSYKHYAFGLLHFAKNCISLRHYRLLVCRSKESYNSGEAAVYRL